MAAIKYCTVRTNYAGTISGNEKLIARLKEADVVKIVDMKTRVTLAHENPAVLLERVRSLYMQNPKIQILVIPFTPNANYAPPKPAPVVKLRKAKR